MNVKKLLSGVAVLAVVVAGAGAGAEPVKTAPAPKQVKTPVPEETFSLKPGQVHEMSAKDLTRIAIGDPEIADVRVLGADKVQITASKQGETTLLVWTQKGERRAYTISVSP